MVKVPNLHIMQDNDDDFSEYYPGRSGWDWLFHEQTSYVPYERITQAYDYLSDYSSIHNLHSASVAQPNPFSNKVMYIIEQLNKLGVKYKVDIFNYSGESLSNFGIESSHKLVNIIAEPNPNVIGPATLFCAHHDVANVHSTNCQDNGASVCNLLRLTELISKSPDESKHTIILFSDCEEYGARGAKRFSKNSKPNKENPAIIDHDTYGQIEATINLELTGKGTVIWSDCTNDKHETALHKHLETVYGKQIAKLKTPPSDAISFRNADYPVLCIGILPKEDMKDRATWRLCHSLNDTLEKCNRKEMEDFTTFLHELTKTKYTNIHGDSIGANKAEGTVQA